MYLNRRESIRRSTLYALGLLGSHDALAQDEDPFPHMRIEYVSPLEYSPLLYLQKVRDDIAPSYAFSAATADEAKAWAGKARSRLWEVLGETHAPARNPHNARMQEKPVALDGYTREKWVLDVEKGRSMPFYVLRPAGQRGRCKTAVCLHGHGNGVRDIIGMPVNREAEELIKVLSEDYAVQTVKKGWCVVAPELWSFGERLDFVQGAREGFDGGCEKPHLNAITLGKCSIGIRAKDIATLIDWIATRDDFDMENLTCMGLSGGGMMTMYISALDERIRRVLVAGYLTEMKGSILGIRHCGCNYVPNLAPDFDFPDIASLIAPRFFIAVTGKRDAIFPLESFRAAASKVSSAYRAYGSPERFVTIEHTGFHSFYPPALDTLLT